MKPQIESKAAITRPIHDTDIGTASAPICTVHCFNILTKWPSAQVPLQQRSLPRLLRKSLTRYALPAASFPKPEHLHIREANCNMTGEAFRKLQVRLADPLLTALTVMIAVILFVVAPLQIAGAITGHYVGFVFEAVLILAAFMVLGSRVAFGAILVAMALIAVALALELEQPSIVEVYLDALAWLIAGLTLAIVIARVVFAPGKVTLRDKAGR
jgi:hypothetical protein